MLTKNLPPKPVIESDLQWAHVNPPLVPDHPNRRGAASSATPNARAVDRL